MNKLRTLLVAIGTVGAAGLLYVARPGVTPQELRAAGLEDCPSVHVACVTLEGNSYHRRALAAYDCRDAGVGFILKGGKRPVMIEGSCEVAPPDVAPPMELPLECACRTKHGACDAALADGGTAPAPFGVTLKPGWSGPGCERKACVELFGAASSWPSTCPER